MPHFFVDDAFSDSKEVLSIPARQRLAAVGLWALCGAWAMGKLTDGHVPTEALNRLGARPKLVDALCESTLWERVSDGIRFTNWAKWQRTREQVESYRAWEAERKRAYREARRNAKTSANPNVSQWDTHGDEKKCPGGTPITPVPVPVPVPNYSGHLSSSVNVSTPPPEPDDAKSATPGAELVRAIIPSQHPAAVQSALRIRASELIHAGAPTETVAAALRLWLTKPNLGPNVLPSLVSEVIKTRTAPAGTPHKMRATAELAERMRAEEQTQLTTSRKGLT